MVLQLGIGTVMIVLTVILAAGFASLAMAVLERAGPWIVRRPHWPKFVLTLASFVLWIQLASTVFVWMWALLYLWLGIFQHTEEAVYFAIVAFTTLGFGDIILPQEWRLLSGITAANGLLMFGFFTAYLVEMMRRVRKEQMLGVVERD